MNEQLEIIGARDSHDTLRAVLAQRSPMKALDVPAGEGILTAYLKDLGWNIHAADIDPGNFKLQDIPFKQVDLNRNLPYEDEEFEAIVCVNALHRVFNVRGALEEFRRILRPGGSLFINVNNYASIDRRLRFLLYGSLDNAINGAGCKQTTDAPEANLRYALHYPQLANLLAAAHLEVVDVRAAAKRPEHTLLAPAALFLRAASLLIPPKSRKRSRVGEANQWGLFPGGRYFYVEARRPND